MKIKKPIAAAVALTVVALAPGIASADFVLDTGTPAGSTTVLLNSSGWYAAEFTVSAGETAITELSAYLTQGVGQVGNTFTWDIYSASGTFLGPNRELPTYTAVGTFNGNGWNSVNVNWVPTTPGNYWVALQVSNSSQTPGLDLPTETSTTTGTVPATAFAFAGTNARYALETANPVGIEVSAVPLPAAVWLLGSSLLGLGPWLRRRRSQSDPATSLSVQ
jgi:hypothetical protein